MKKARILVAGILSVAALTALFPMAHRAAALPTDAPDSANVVSPEVGPDHKVTFRLKMPGATAVRITGDFALNGTPMTKGADGIWTYSATLHPAIWGYTFNVDGVRIVDPGNLYISSGAAHLKSYVEVPGDKDHPEFWEVRDVPHGIVHDLRYKSPTLGDRHVMVYTPPGYDAAAAKTYPVMYLLHSATDNETYWFQVGRANVTMDNLLADGKAKPAIVVSCFGWPSIPAGPEDTPEEVYYVKTIGKEMVDNVIPFIEKQFRTSKESKDRGILGFSGMGGCQAISIGLNNPGTFGYIASLSSGFRANQDLNANFTPMLADVEKVKKGLKKVLIKVGSDETGNVTPSQTLDTYLTGKGIPHTLTIVPAGIHSWVSWREYFKDFMADSFKD